MNSFVSHILKLSQVYQAATGASEDKVSKALFKDGAGLRRLAAGGDLLTGSYARSLSWFSEHWPEGTEWPDGIERPPVRPVVILEGRRSA